MTKPSQRTIWVPVSSWEEFKRMAVTQGTTPSNVIRSMVYDIVENPKRLQDILQQSVPEEQQKQKAIYIDNEQWEQLRNFSRQAKISRTQIIRKMIIWLLAHTELPQTVLKRPKKRFRITLSEDLWEDLNRRAKAMNRTISSIIEEVLRKSLKL